LITVKVRCPKCKSDSAWFEKDYRDVFIRCTCGYCKIYQTKLEESIVIEHRDSDDDVNLPRTDSQLFKCVTMLAILRRATTLEITEHLNDGRRNKGVKITSSDTASRLAVLRFKGLVYPAVEKKGVAGGSTWVLTEIAKKLLNVKV